MYAKHSKSSGNDRMKPRYAPRSIHIDFHLIYEAPAPVLTLLHRSHDGMAGRVKVFRRMTIRRGIAASNMAADHAHPQMHPPAANLQAIFTALRRRLHLPNLIEMRTLHDVHSPLPLTASSTFQKPLYFQPPMGSRFRDIFLEKAPCDPLW
jgi:hypothetical protein